MNLTIILNNAYKEMYRVDKFLGDIVFSKEDIIDEKEYRKEMIQSFIELKSLFQNLHECPLEDENKFAEAMVSLHVKLNNIAWYFNNMHNGLRKLIQHYPHSEQFMKDNS